MRTKPSVGAALAVATALLFAAALASAHQDHKKPAERLAEEPTAAVEAPAVPAETPQRAIPHDHSTHPTAPPADEASSLAEPETELPKALAWLGKFHPPLTHFPIALLAAAALAELFYMRTGEIRFEHAVDFTVRFGALAGLLAAALGWLFAGIRIVDDEWAMTLHRWAGTGTALLACGLLVSLQRATRSTFRVVLFSCAALAGATGLLGGALIYGLDHYAW